MPTGSFTTTYTVTSCPPLDQGCETGVVVTETVAGRRGGSTVTVTSEAGGGDDDSDDDDDDAGVRPDALTVLLVVAGMITLGVNLL